MFNMLSFLVNLQYLDIVNFIIILLIKCIHCPKKYTTLIVNVAKGVRYLY